jgi:hypothetical protein
MYIRKIFTRQKAGATWWVKNGLVWEKGGKADIYKKQQVSNVVTWVVREQKQPELAAEDVTSVPDRVSEGRGGGGDHWLNKRSPYKSADRSKLVQVLHAIDHDVTYRSIRFSSDHERLQMLIFLGYHVLDLVVWVQKVILVWTGLSTGVNKWLHHTLPRSQNTN